ncbi:Vps53-like protein [Hyaloraphidium curvatum]|nr:Vps53-like protein [Hyaloraphidium curvatum]
MSEPGASAGLQVPNGAKHDAPGSPSLPSPSSATRKGVNGFPEQGPVDLLVPERRDSLAKLPADLEDAIDKILGESDDAIGVDSSSFNAVDYINTAFPNEQSLAHLDRILAQLRTKVKKLDEEIRELVRTQTEAGAGAVEELREVKQAIETLHARIKRIKERATQSEDMVQEITKDIKSLDYAKRNLTSSITMLRRLQMLVSAVGQLAVMTSKRQYRETAQLLQAILQLLSHFASYRTIKFVQDVFEQVDNIQSDLKKRILNEFEGAFLSQATLRNSVGILNEACVLADVIQRDNPRRQLIDWYCDMELKDYRSIFRGNDEVAALDNTSRRYAWLRRELKTHDDEHAAIFPQHWKVAEVLCEKFCDDTRKDLVDVLAKDNQRGALDVKLMLQTLQQTIDFENKLDRRFAGKDPDRVSMDRRSEDAPSYPAKFARRISVAFEPYLDHYIAAEDRNLADMMAQYRAKPVADDDSSISVLASSTDLFYSYRQTLVHCSKMSTGQPFLNLCKVFAKYLRVYADFLTGRLPREERAALNEASAHEICLLLNTAEYCHVTISQLEDKLKEKIDPNFRDSVDMSTERDIFLNVANGCMLALVRGLENAIEPAWHIMTTKIPWNTMTNTADQSEYVFVIQSAVQSTVPMIKRTLTASKYFRSFCDKVAESVFAKFYGSIFRCRSIGEVGAEQMLLDLNAVNSIFAHMPRIDGDRESAVPAVYTKILAKGVAKCETLLKVLMTPAEPHEGLVSTYLLLFGSDASAAIFTRILDLKGIPKPNQGPAIDTFNRRTVGLVVTPSTAPPPPAPPPPPIPPGSTASSAASAASAATAAATAVLQGALTSSVSTAAQLASAAQKSTSISFPSGFKSWMNMGRSNTATRSEAPATSPVSSAVVGGVSPTAPAGAPPSPKPPSSTVPPPSPKPASSTIAQNTTSAFAKMAALGQNFLSSGKPAPPPPPKS